eukprot:8525896-Pyramimonas_sp.AAC.1
MRAALLVRRAVEFGFVRMRAYLRTPTFSHPSQGASWPRKTGGAMGVGDAAFGRRAARLLAPSDKARRAGTGNSSPPQTPHAA